MPDRSHICLYIDVRSTPGRGLPCALRVSCLDLGAKNSLVFEEPGRGLPPAGRYGLKASGLLSPRHGDLRGLPPTAPKLAAVQLPPGRGLDAAGLPAADAGRGLQGGELPTAAHEGPEGVHGGEAQQRGGQAAQRVAGGAATGRGEEAAGAVVVGGRQDASSCRGAHEPGPSNLSH